MNFLGTELTIYKSATEFSSLIAMEILSSANRGQAGYWIDRRKVVTMTTTNKNTPRQESLPQR